MMEQPKTIICLFCQEQVDFTHLENQTYLDHLDWEHHIVYYRQLTLMVNLLDKNCLEYFSNMPPAEKPKTWGCLLCRKENNLGDDKGDGFFNHLRNEHMIISNLKLIRSINLMDNDGLRGIIKKFEEIYEVDDEDDINNEEKMLIEDGETFDDSKATAQPDQEEMYGELEEELINGSELVNYYESQSVDSDMVEQTSMDSQHVDNQFDSFLNNSNTSLSNDQINLMEDSTSNSFQSSSSLNTSINFASEREFDAVTKSEILNNLSYGESSTSNTPNIKRSKKVAKGETSDFSEAVRSEIEKGNLSTTMDIPFEQTSKIMKEITIMFMTGKACNLCVKMFKTRAHLHEHIESIHNPFEVYFCLVCQLPMTNSNKHRHHKKSKKCSTGQLQLKYLE